MKNTNNFGFTIIELIVTLIIFAILGTIGIFSYMGYISPTRDAKRIEQITSLNNELNNYLLSSKLPLPNNYVEVQSSGTLIGYQGYAGKTLLNSLKMYGDWQDPLDKEFYTYYTIKEKNKFQLLYYLENTKYLENNLTSKISTGSYINRYLNVTGANIGLITESGSNQPIQKIASIISAGKLDILNTNNYYIANISNTEVISGTGKTLIKSIPKANCKRLKQTFKYDTDGAYQINPTGLNEFTVYCNMTMDGGGWTLAGVTASGNNPASNFLDGNIGTSNIPKNLNPGYDYSIDASILNFEEVTMGLNGETEKHFGFFIPNGFVSSRAFEETAGGSQTCIEHSAYYTYDSGNSKYRQQYYVYKESLITSRFSNNSKGGVSLDMEVGCNNGGSLSYSIALYRDKDSRNCAGGVCNNSGHPWTHIDSTQKTPGISQVPAIKFPTGGPSSVWLMVR